MADPTQPLPPAYIAADEGPQLDAITIAVFTLAVVAVTLRFLARVLIKAPIWWDDFLILVALVRIPYSFPAMRQV